MRINVAIPEAHVDAPVLDAALEAVTRLNESMLERNEIPTFEKALQYGIKWKPEPPGDEHFDHGHEVMKRKWGDCDDLAPLHAASLRHTGVDPEARAIVYQSGPKRWHAVVQRSDGTIDDPSRRAGMGKEVSGVMGAWLPPMIEAPRGVSGAYIVRPQIAMRPMRGWIQARADLPWHWRDHLEDPATPSDYAMTTLHTAPIASTALTGAILGAVELGEAAGISTDDHIDRLCALADAINGALWDELAGTYGEENANAAAAVVGSFWKGLAKAAHAAMPFASKAVQFVPGVGPVASTALDLAHEHFPDLDKKSAVKQMIALEAQNKAHEAPHMHHHIHFG